MISVTGIRFRPAGKIYYFENAPFAVATGDAVVVDTQNGEDIGTIAFVNQKVDESDCAEQLSAIIRKATSKDLEIKSNNEKRALDALPIVKKKVKDAGLLMNVVNVEFSFDGSRMVVNFTSEERVDFRGLLKDLSSQFKKRVELRQIGIRDETKIVGGLGVCGQPCCCRRFLDDFGHVSVKMAKTQNLSLNPTKISGLCGRLMCCLQYENDFYEEAQKDLPKIGGTVETPEGHGKLLQTNILKGTANVRFEKNDETTIKSFPLCDISRCENCRANCPSKQPQKDSVSKDKKDENKNLTEKEKNQKHFSKHNHKNFNKKGEKENGIQN